MLLKKGSKGADVKKLQKGLNALGFDAGIADGDFGMRTEDAVEDFQREVGLWPDGLFGRDSVREWNELCLERGMKKHCFGDLPVASDPQETSDKLTWVQAPADKWGNGYNRFTLRSDTAVVYQKVYDEVHRLGGIITSAGGKRSLASEASPSRSKKSFHYTGRALDLALYSGMHDPNTEPYLVVPDGDRRFQVWCKLDNENAPGAAEVEVVTLVCCYGGKYGKHKEWTGRAFNITAIFEAHGFATIRCRTSFKQGTGSYGGAEWWHFQWQGGLVKGTSTFGEELLKVYSLAEARRFVYWNEAKDAVFGVSWF